MEITPSPSKRQLITTPTSTHVCSKNDSPENILSKSNDNLKIKISTKNSSSLEKLIKSFNSSNNEAENNSKQHRELDQQINKNLSRGSDDKNYEFNDDNVNMLSQHKQQRAKFKNLPVNNYSNASSDELGLQSEKLENTMCNQSSEHENESHSSNTEPLLQNLHEVKSELTDRDKELYIAEFSRSSTPSCKQNIANNINSVLPENSSADLTLDPKNSKSNELNNLNSVNHNNIKSPHRTRTSSIHENNSNKDTPITNYNESNTCNSHNSNPGIFTLLSRLKSPKPPLTYSKIKSITRKLAKYGWSSSKVKHHKKEVLLHLMEVLPENLLSDFFKNADSYIGKILKYSVEKQIDSGLQIQDSSTLDHNPNSHSHHEINDNSDSLDAKNMETSSLNNNNACNNMVPSLDTAAGLNLNNLTNSSRLKNINSLKLKNINNNHNHKTVNFAGTMNLSESKGTSLASISVRGSPVPLTTGFNHELFQNFSNETCNISNISKIDNDNIKNDLKDLNIKNFNINNSNYMNSDYHHSIKNKVSKNPEIEKETGVDMYDSNLILNQVALSQFNKPSLNNLNDNFISSKPAIQNTHRDTSLNNSNLNHNNNNNNTNATQNIKNNSRKSNLLNNLTKNKNKQPSLTSKNITNYFNKQEENLNHSSKHNSDTHLVDNLDLDREQDPETEEDTVFENNKLGNLKLFERLAKQNKIRIERNKEQIRMNNRSLFDTDHNSNLFNNFSKKMSSNNNSIKKSLEC